ncbi:MAG: immunoglobulin-like domain-containing protein [Bacilli bacterium]
MNLLKLNAKKILVLILAFIASFAMIACEDEKDDVLLQLEEAVNSITLGDTTALVADFTIVNKTNRHDLEITWELVDADDTLKLERVDDDFTKVVVTPTEYTEDEDGEQTNPWGKGTLKATVSIGDKSKSREWDLHVKPNGKTEALTVTQIKKVANDTGVEATGTVSFVRADGFYITDSTGSLYIYTSTAPAEDVKLGAVVSVKGKKVEFYSAPQITGPTVEIITTAPASGYDYSNVAPMEIADMEAMTTNDKDHYGKLVKVTGMVIKNYISPADGSTVSEYALQDILTGSVAAIYNSTEKSVKDILATKVGQYVTMVVMVYDRHSVQLVWRNYGIPGTIEDAETPSLTDEEIVARAANEIELLFEGKSFATNLNLITEGTSGGTISWSSGNTDVLDDDGTITTPDNDTEVTLTYTITSGDETETGTVNVTILALQKSTIKEAIDKIDQEEQMVIIEGVIIGADSDDYYYLADETGVIFVRNKLAADDLVVGNKVRVVATGTIFNRSSEFTRQVGANYTVTKLDDQIHPSPLEAVDADITDFDFTITADDMATKVPQEELYGKLVTITAYFVKRTSGNFTDPYLAVSLEDGAAAMIIHHKSVNRAVFDDLIGKQVTVTGVIYSFNVNSGWRFGFMDREGDLVVELTEAEKLALAKEEIEAVVSDDKAVSGDLDFFESAKSQFIKDAKYTWESNKTDIIANDGTFEAPDADTDVVITVKVFLDGNTEGTPSATHTYTVKAKAPAETTGGVMISQAYGGGGNSGATLKNDFVELYNSSDEDIDITGWVVWYASATGQFKAIGSESYQTGYVLTGTIKAKSFFLIQASAGTGGTEDLPTPDDISELGIGGSAFKIALTNSDTVPTGPDGANIVDFVGAASNASLYEGSGAAPAPSNTKAIVRDNLTDTNDNSADFVVADPNPRNSSHK